MRGITSVLLATVLIVAPLAAQQPTSKKKLTLRATLEMPSYGSYQLSPDGRRILFTRSERDTADWSQTSHIWLHELDGGRTYQLTNSAKGESNPRWLPDGRVLFSSNRDTANALWVITPGQGEATKLVEADDAPANGTISPDLERLVFTDRTERPDKKEWDARVKRKDDGYYAEKRLTFTQVFVYDMDGEKKRQLTGGEYDHSAATFSPDGRWIAYTSNRTGTTARDANHSNNTDIFLMPSDSGAERRVTTNEGPDNGPSWSPDGAWIAYTSSDYHNNSADQSDLKVIRTEGGEPVNLTKDFDYSVSNVEWSKDGRHLYFSAAEGLTTNLYRVPLTGGEPTRIPFGDGFVLSNFQMTEDGRQWLVTGGSIDEPDIVYLGGAEGRDPRRIFQEHLLPINILWQFRSTIKW